MTKAPTHQSTIIGIAGTPPALTEVRLLSDQTLSGPHVSHRIELGKDPLAEAIAHFGLTDAKMFPAWDAVGAQTYSRELRRMLARGI